MVRRHKRSHNIASGFFRTNIGGILLMTLENRTTQQFVVEIYLQIVVGRINEIKDFNDTVFFLFSSVSNYLIGHIVVMNGGRFSWQLPAFTELLEI